MSDKEELTYYWDYEKTMHENIYKIWTISIIYGRCFVLIEKKS